MMCGGPGLSRRPRRTGRANVRPVKKNETTASGDEIEIDELVESLIETFPASDPPAWIPLVRVGNPKRKTKFLPTRKT
jgi:hypothetical protein